MNSEVTRLKLFLNLVVLSISIYGISQKNYLSHGPSIFEKIVMSIFAPIQEGIVTTKRGFGNYVDDYIMLVNTNKRNRELLKEKNELEKKLFWMEELERENIRLKSLLQFGEEVQHSKVLAQVIGWNSSSQFKILRINKGHDDGIRERSPVVTSKGLVGYIYRVTANFADILTILDNNSRIDALVARTRSHGIVEGYTDEVSIMKYVNRTEEVQLGDEVMTAGLGKIFPKGIKIGSIAKIERESYGISQFIEIRPAVDFSRIEEVVVLLAINKDKKLVELKELNKKSQEDL